MCNPRKPMNRQKIDEDEGKQQQKPQLFATTRPKQGKRGKTNDDIGNTLAAQLPEVSMLSTPFIPISLPVALHQKTTEKRKSSGAPQHLHYVRHDYHDYANVVCEETCHCEPLDISESTRVNGSNPSFPMRLHIMLEAIEKSGQTHIVSWQPHGRCFRVHKPKEFVRLALPLHFQQTKLTSFQRQLNMYGFCRLTAGPDEGSYYHELFLRGKPCLARRIQRMRIKGNGVRPQSNPNQEPNFYNMPPVLANNNNNKKVLRIGQNDVMELAGRQLSENDLMDFAGRKFHFVDPAEVERRNSADNAFCFPGN